LSYSSVRVALVSVPAATIAQHTAMVGRTGMYLPVAYSGGGEGCAALARVTGTASRPEAVDGAVTVGEQRGASDGGRAEVIPNPITAMIGPSGWRRPAPGWLR
jgi:hypothetical protein